MRGKLILENGKIFNGKIFGEIKESVGKLCFNTSMSGYEEIMTDPATHGLIMTMTYPMIGNYGLNLEDMESDKVQLKALIIKEDAKLPNNFRCEMTLDGFLRQYGVVGFKGIDTRYLTQIIKNEGSMKAIITSETLTKKEIEEKFNNFNTNPFEASTNEKYVINSGGSKKIGVLDLGVKKSTLSYLEKAGFEIIVFPPTITANEILKENIEALIISNGCDDPRKINNVVENIKEIIGKLPIFGEVLGCQILALALGGKVDELKYGHRGSYPIKNIKTSKIINSYHNTGYVITEVPSNIEITYRGINMDTIEGIESKEMKIVGTQFVPDLYENEKDELIKFLRKI